MKHVAHIVQCTDYTKNLVHPSDFFPLAVAATKHWGNLRSPSKEPVRHRLQSVWLLTRPIEDCHQKPGQLLRTESVEEVRPQSTSNSSIRALGWCHASPGRNMPKPQRHYQQAAEGQKQNGKRNRGGTKSAERLGKRLLNVVNIIDCEKCNLTQSLLLTGAGIRLSRCRFADLKPLL